MPPRRTATPPPSAAGPARPRKTDAEIRQGGHNPFLRPEHTSDGAQFTMTGWKRPDPPPPAAATQFILEVANDEGVTFDLGVRLYSPDHHELFKAFGTEDWRLYGKGSKVTVTIKAGTTAGTSFVNIAGAVPADPPF